MKIGVLDKGYVRLISKMGNDLEVVNDARVSHGKESEWDRKEVCTGWNPWGEDYKTIYSLKEKDRKLLFDLAKDNHWSPFSHSAVKFEFKSPWIVKEQWRKSIVGGVYTELPPDPDEAWNEKSFRYVTRTPETYTVEPENWLKKPAKRSHQGDDGPLEEEQGIILSDYLLEDNDEAVQRYRLALAAGASPQQARFFLPVSIYTHVRWRPSLYRVISWLKLREAEDAQWEIREYAKAVRELVQPLFPVSFEAWGL